MPQANQKSPSGQEQQQTSTMKNPYPYPAYQHAEDDTINLYEMLMTLWKNKLMVIGITVVVALGAIIYVLTVPRFYKAETILLPPKEKDFQSLNILELNKKKVSDDLNFVANTIDSKTVFRKFKQNLKSRRIQKKFILEKGLMEFLAPEQTQEDINEDVYKGFAKMINVDDDDGVTILSIELNNAEMAANWVNEFAKFVDKETIAILVEDVQDKIETMITELEYAISSKRAMAERRRQDQIVRYREHAQIAKQIGMVGRVDATNIIQNSQMNMDVTTSSTPLPLYYLGYEALIKQIEILSNRKTDDPFITGLRDLQEQLALLSSIKINYEYISSVEVDQAAFKPKYAIKPNRRLIVSVATAVGLFSGIFLVFFIEFIKTQRKKYLE